MSLRGKLGKGMTSLCLMVPMISLPWFGKTLQSAIYISAESDLTKAGIAIKGPLPDGCSIHPMLKAVLINRKTLLMRCSTDPLRVDYTALDVASGKTLDSVAASLPIVYRNRAFFVSNGLEISADYDRGYPINSLNFYIFDSLSGRFFLKRTVEAKAIPAECFSNSRRESGEGLSLYKISNHEAIFQADKEVCNYTLRVDLDRL